jgi:formamidopyrimidine-DNA glycosylase
MPELPEVETVKNTLNQLIAGKTIQKVDVRLARLIRRPDDIRLFETLLANRSVQRVERRGKFLLIHLDELVLVSHLRMEGRYGLYHGHEPEEKHTHVVFHFTDGTQLRYKDVRQFGTMDLLAPGELLTHPSLGKLGAEPLSDEFTADQFRRLIRGRTTRIKPLLLNQECVVGIGNIYADESLFAAGIHPERIAGQLTDEELNRLHAAIVETLREAVAKGGSSIKSYVNGQGEMGMFQHQLKVYGRKGEPCVRCGSLIERIVVSGRGTHYCPVCQPSLKPLGR